MFASFAVLLAVSLFHRFNAHPSDVLSHQAAKDLGASYDTLVDLFESIEHFLSRLDIYTKIPLKEALKDVVIKIMVALLSTLAVATKQIKQGRSSEFVLHDALPCPTQCREIHEEAFWRGRGRRALTEIR